MNIVLFGPPGAGKGTQAKLICEKYFLNHLSTGDLLRKESSKETSLGIQIKNTINDGKLVSDETTIELIKQFINENKNNNTRKRGRKSSNRFGKNSYRFLNKSI